MKNRRNFIKQLGIASIAATVPSFAFSEQINPKTVPNLAFSGQIKPKKDDLIWAGLIHLSYNMWQDFTPDKYKTETYSSEYTETQVADWANHYQPHLTCEQPAWDKIIQKMADSGLNMVLIDLGDGVQYESHPEISVKNAWTIPHLKKVLSKIRDLGMEPIPKLNFSAGHKSWLGPYQRQISSDVYYQVAKNLIDEVVEIFDNPRLFHIGMDEETCSHQGANLFTAVRGKDLWWHDFHYLVEQVERNNARSWIWSDNIWRNKEDFLSKMPKSVLQSNWDYEEQGLAFNEKGEPNDAMAQGYVDLEKHGYDQVPCGSLWLHGKWDNYGNMGRLVKHNKQIIAPERLKGFLQTVWLPTLAPCVHSHYKAYELLQEAKRKYY